MAKRKNTGLKYIFIFMGFVFVYFAYTIYGQLDQISSLEGQLENKKNNLVEIETEIGRIEKELKDSESLSFVEKIARDEYGLVKPKEVIFIDRDKHDSKNPFGNN